MAGIWTTLLYTRTVMLPGKVSRKYPQPSCPGLSFMIFNTICWNLVELGECCEPVVVRTSNSQVQVNVPRPCMSVQILSHPGATLSPLKAT